MLRIPDVWFRSCRIVAVRPGAGRSGTHFERGSSSESFPSSASARMAAAVNVFVREPMA